MTKHLGIAVFASLAIASAAMAAPPENVSAKRHPHLAHAQKAIDNAFAALDEAQKANEFDMEGHAAKAKELLQQADAEIKQAAEAANQNHK
jgi:hypothetical protein